MAKREYIILDTETASFDGGVCEIAWYVIDENLNKLDEAYARINPERPISPSASGVHGITNADVDHEPTLAEYVGSRFANSEVFLIGHKCSFDIKMIANVITPAESMCTLRLARKIYPDAPDHKLQTLMYELKLSKQQSHSALGDVQTTYEMLRRMSLDANMPLDRLHWFSQQPILVKKMAFGKHKDADLVSLPRNYITWLLNLPDLDEDLRWSLNQV